MKYRKDMVHIRGGSFDMGSKDGDTDESPVHMVKVNDFYMGKYEVTKGEFREFLQASENYRTDAERKGGDNWLSPFNDFTQPDSHPAVCVSWNDAIAYCNWRSKKEGLTPVYTIKENTVTADFTANGYRLPTEAEWEYAARSGEKGYKYKYSWGNGNPVNKRGGNIRDKTLKQTLSLGDIWEGYDDGYCYTSPVDAFDSNEFGLYDMTGNVNEWCWDWYDGNYYKDSPNNPSGPLNGNTRVVRGGSWSSKPGGVRAASRDYEAPEDSSVIIGFRLSRTF